MMILVLCAVLAGLYITGTALRDLFFHPLHRIPCHWPWVAFPLLRHISAVRGNVDLDIKRWHERYGPVVRFSPDEVSFINSEAWDEIYGRHDRRYSLPKSKFSTSNTADIINANDTDHARYRKALAHGFSVRGVREQESMIRSHLDKLIVQLQSSADSRQSIDLVTWYRLTTFDIIGELAFGEHFGGLDRGSYHPWVAFMTKYTRLIPFFKAMDTYPVIFRTAFALISSNSEAINEHMQYSQDLVQKRIHATSSSVQGRPDFVDSIMRQQGTKNEMSEREIEANASVIIIAGSETPADLLCAVTYWLLRTPEVLLRVRNELQDAFATPAEITFDAVATKLPLLTACLNEALRLYPSVPGGLQRVTEASTTLKGFTIPPYTQVGLHQLSAYTSPSNFRRPDCFLPERWNTEVPSNPASPFYNDNREVFQPFSAGPRNCIGKNMAYAIMRTALARMLWEFDLELCVESENWHVQKTYGLWDKKPLLCQLRKRAGPRD
ncbi:cytochrome P450 [Aspergillus homomorphus CBS 101889]|uniref:Cytochrome P450 n=1 Tax=Aspergillus homomorphus (strain CBS 101889) TaxID=1450537 RepID=A0A395HXE6_ASPHC|nr:cytochrome P450 [Aspergillus homomorphus CBS 101889]RAL12477.1 cytochrome P450 [Aspergillus homomorphus CBS 101889]